MASPLLGEIKMFAGNFAPRGWAFCSGQLMDISQNDALFALLGTTYGGDGVQTFAMPDLRGRLPVHMGTSVNTYTLGEISGAESVALTAQQLPAHSHQPKCSSADGISSDPTNNFWAAQPALLQYSAAGTANSVMKPGLLSNAGGSQPHDNMPPFVAVNYIIALEGVFPSQN